MKLLLVHEGKVIVREVTNEQLDNELKELEVKDLGGNIVHIKYAKSLTLNKSEDGKYILRRPKGESVYLKFRHVDLEGVLITKYFKVDPNCKIDRECPARINDFIDYVMSHEIVENLI